MAGAQQHAAVARDQRKDVAGPGEIVGAGIGIGERAAARGALIRRNAGAAVGLVVDRDGKGGGVIGLVVRHHRIEPQPARILGGDRRADDAGGMADDEGHLLGGAERGRDDQIALALAVVIIGDDDDFAVGKGLQNFLDRIGHFLETLAAWPGCISRTWGSARSFRRRQHAACEPASLFQRGGSRRAQDRRPRSVPAYGSTSRRSLSRASISARLSSSRPAVGRLDHREQLVGVAEPRHRHVVGAGGIEIVRHPTAGRRSR